MNRTGLGIVAPAALRPFLAVLVAAALAAGCAAMRKPGGEARSDLFEALAERGWRIAEPVRAFGPDTLYEEIDGEAELFLPYSFRELRVAILSPADRPAAQARVEVYLHGSPRDAYGVYSQYRFPGQRTGRIDSSEAILSDVSVDFFRGPAFVRIRASARETPGGDLERLGRELCALLPGSGEFPRETEALRVPGAAGGEGPVVFHRRALLGYEALAPGFETRYEDAEFSGKILLIRAEDAGPAPGFVRKLQGVLPGFSPAGENLYRADLPSGTLWLLSRESYHLGLAGKATLPQARAILSDLDGRAARLLSGQP